MARERKAAPGIGHNGSMPPANKIREFYDRIENLLDELAGERDEYMERTRAIRSGMQRVMLEAEEAGIPKRGFKAVIRARKLADDIRSVRDALASDEQETFDDILAALGDLADTPLGQAALARAERTGA